MTHHLARLRLANVGQPSARFKDLTLDFTEGTTPVASVLWLKNGGGKSTILSLFLSLLLPRKYDFMGRAANRDLVDYVQTGDTAHVVTEWHPTQSENLFGEPEFVLIVGAVYEWPGRTRPEKFSRNELQVSWYSYYTTPGVPAAADLSLAGRRQEFLDRLRGWHAQHPGMDLVVADSQEQWAKTLRSRGIDTDLFLRQKQMNEVEGGAAELFTVKSVDQFINLLLELTVQGDRPAMVAENLSAVADRVARKGRHLAERRFCETAVPLLTRIAETSATVQDTQAAAATADTAAQRLAAALKAAEDLLEQRSDDLKEQSDRADSSRRQAETAADRTQATISAYQLAEARFDETAAREARDAADQAVELAERTKEAWAAAIDVAELRTREAEHARWRAAREVSDRESAPQRSEHDHAATVYRTRLGEEASNAREAAARHNASAADADEAARRARDLEAAARKRGREASKRAAAAGRDISMYEEDVRAAVRLGDLAGVDEDPSAALEAALSADAEHEQAIQRADEAIEAARVGTVDLAAEGQEVAVRIKGLERDLADAVTVQEDLLGRLGALSDDPLVRLILQTPPGEPVDVWGEADRVGRSLEQQIAAAHRAQIDAESEDTEDARLADAVQRTGYLPTTLDAERVARLLVDRGLPAQPGWEYVREVHAANALRAEAGAPLRRIGAGVVVPAEHAEQAAAILATAAEPTLALVGVFTNTAADEAADEPTVPNGAPVWEQPEPGALDAEAAQIRAEQVERRRAARRQTVQSAAAVARKASALLDTLTRFLEACPTGHLRGLEDRIGALRESIRRAGLSQNDLARRRAVLERSGADAVTDRRRAQEARRALAATITRLRQLADRQPGYDEAKRQQMAAEQEAWEADATADEANRAAERHGDTRDQERRAAEELERTASGYDKDARSILFLDGEHAMPAVPAITVEEARSAYAGARRRWDAHVAEDVTAAREQDSLNEVNRAAERVHRFPADVVERATSLLTTPEGQGDDLRRRASVRAQRTFTEASDRRTEARIHLKTCESATKARRKAIDTARRASAELSPPPESKAACEAQIALLSSEHEAHLESARTAAAERDEATTARASAIETQRIFRSHRTHLPPPAPGVVSEPFTGDGDDAERAAASANRSRNDTRDRAVEATDAMQRAIAAARKSATSASVTLHVRERILNEPDLVVAASAKEWADQMGVRIQHIDAELAEITGDQRIVADELRGLVREALRTMKTAERHSRISGTTGPWEGKQFLRIRFEEPDDAALRTIMVRVIDEFVEKNTKPQGMALLQAAVKAAAAPSGFKVSILKPTGDGTAERADVTLLSQWSGGEALTVAIALYCTLAKVSAANRGTPGADGGALILDNPIGKANSPALLSLQHTIARSSGVQLIYATGVNDLGALAKFGSIIRLDNRAAASGQRRYVVQTPEDQGIRAARVARTGS